MEGFKLSPHALLSRRIGGIRGKTLMVNLPGSPKAVQEGLLVICPALPHALAALSGRASEEDHTFHKKRAKTALSPQGVARGILITNRKGVE